MGLQLAVIATQSLTQRGIQEERRENEKNSFDTSPFAGFLYISQP